MHNYLPDVARKAGSR